MVHRFSLLTILAYGKIALRNIKIVTYNLRRVNLLSHTSVMINCLLQFMLYQNLELAGFHDHRLRPHAQHPLADFTQAGHLEADFDPAVDELLDPLALVPDLFPHVAGPGRADPDDHAVELVLHHFEAVVDVVLEGERVRYLEVVVGHPKHVDAVHHERADVVPQVTVADDVDGPVVEPDLVGVHFAGGPLVLLQGPVAELDALVVGRRAVNLTDDLAAAAVVLAGPAAHLIGGPDAIQVGQGLGREHAPDLFQNAFLGGLEHRAFEHVEQVAPKVQAEHLGQGETPLPRAVEIARPSRLNCVAHHGGTLPLSRSVQYHHGPHLDRQSICGPFLGNEHP